MDNAVLTSAILALGDEYWDIEALNPQFMNAVPGMQATDRSQRTAEAAPNLCDPPLPGRVRVPAIPKRLIRLQLPASIALNILMA